LEAAVALFRAGRLEQAQQLAQTRVDAYPDDVDTLYLLGTIAYRLEQHLRAQEILSRVQELAPTHGRSLLLLGHAQRRLGDRAGARQCYARAHTLNAAAFEPPFYLGLMTRDAGEHLAAAQWYLLAALLNPGCEEAMQGMLEALKDALRANVAPVDDDSSRHFHRADDEMVISFIICSNNDTRFKGVSAEIAGAMTGKPYEIIGIHDARSLCEGYNRGAARASGHLFVFCHDDIQILDRHFCARLTSALAHFDVVGVAGNALLRGPVWNCAEHPHLHGWIAGPMNGPEPVALTVYGIGPALAQHIQALDGVFIAMRRSAYEQIRFDEQRFDGFHFYDLDFSYRAHRAGLGVAVLRDLLLLHRSGGSLDAAWQHYEKIFLAKFPEAAPQGQQGQAHFFRIPLASTEELCRYCASLRALVARSEALLAASGLPDTDPRRIRARELSGGATPPT
jgi:GT2 family glycosyltransferase